MSDNFLATHAEWIIPLTLLVLQFLMKLLVAEALSAIRVWETMLEAPVDVGFLALTFIAVVLLHFPNNPTNIYGLTAIYMVLLIVSVALWKISPKTFAKRDLRIAAALSITNFSLTIIMLVYSVSLLIPHGASPNGH